ncbi:MAG: hypothetical protein KJ721_03845 [Nanoarchaeota archaeon]|nr:hypothetical protein [Nanoarchaeota archaeon]
MKNKLAKIAGATGDFVKKYVGRPLYKLCEIYTGSVGVAIGQPDLNEKLDQIAKGYAEYCNKRGEPINENNLISYFL